MDRREAPAGAPGRRPLPGVFGEGRADERGAGQGGRGRCVGRLGRVSFAVLGLWTERKGPRRRQKLAVPGAGEGPVPGGLPGAPPRTEPAQEDAGSRVQGPARRLCLRLGSPFCSAAAGGRPVLGAPPSPRPASSPALGSRGAGRRRREAPRVGVGAPWRGGGGGAGVLPSVGSERRVGAEGQGPGFVARGGGRGTRGGEVARRGRAGRAGGLGGGWGGLVAGGADEGNRLGGRVRLP